MKIPFGYGEKIGNFLGTRAARATFNKIPGVKKLPTLQKLSESWREHAQRIGQAGQTASHFGVEDEGVGGISVPSLSRVRIPGSLTRAASTVAETAARAGVNIAANVVDSLSRLPIPDLDTRILESISKMEIGTTIDLEGVLGNIGSAAETAGGFVYGIWKDNPDLQAGFKKGFKKELRTQVGNARTSVGNIAINIRDGIRRATDPQNDLISRESTPERLAREQETQEVHERSQAANIQGRAIADRVRQRQQYRREQELTRDWEDVDSSDVESSSSGEEEMDGTPLSDRRPLLNIGSSSHTPLNRRSFFSSSISAPRAQRAGNLTGVGGDQLSSSLRQARVENSSLRRPPTPSPSPSEGSGDTSPLLISPSPMSPGRQPLVSTSMPAPRAQRVVDLTELEGDQLPLSLTQARGENSSLRRPPTPSPSPSEGSGDTSPLLISPSPMSPGRQPLVSTSMPAPRAQRVVDLTELEGDQLPLSLTQARGDFLNASSSSRRSPIPSSSSSEGSGDTEMLISRSSSRSSTSSNSTDVIDPDDRQLAELLTDRILDPYRNSSTLRSSVARPPSPSPSEGSGDTSPLLGNSTPLDTSPFRRGEGIGYQRLGGMESRAADGISSVNHMPALGSSTLPGGVGPQSGNYRSTTSSGDRLYGNLDSYGVGSGISQQPSILSRAGGRISEAFSRMMDSISAARNRGTGYNSIEMGGGLTSGVSLSMSGETVGSVSIPPSGAVPGNRTFGIEGGGHTVASPTSTETKSRASMDKGFMALMGVQMGLEFLSSNINQITAEAERDVQLMASSQQQAELNEENNAQADQNRHNEGLQWLQMRRGSRRF